MSYRETLPNECPPATAEEITVARIVFRLVRTFPAANEDFRSQRAENPGQLFNGVTECQACGLSVFADVRDAERATKLPRLRGRSICRLTLDSGAGRIQQTGRPSHHTWWPLAAFDILEHCEAENI